MKTRLGRKWDFVPAEIPKLKLGPITPSEISLSPNFPHIESFGAFFPIPAGLEVALGKNLSETSGSLFDTDPRCLT
jgi:hypothetical protein